MVEIPIQPQRIIAEEYLGSLIALDIIPVGAPGLTIKNYYFKEELQGVANCFYVMSGMILFIYFHLSHIFFNQH